MKARFLLTALCVFLSACSVSRDAQLRKAVIFEYGDYTSSDVRRLLKEGADVNSRGEDGRTALLNAYGIGCGVFEYEPEHEDAVKSLRLLLAHGADIRAVTPQGHNALDLALSYHDNELLVAVLREQGLRASNPEYEMVWHAMHNHAADVRRLLAAGVSPNAHSVRGESALWATMPHINVKSHSAECMELLLAAGADVHEKEDDRTILDAARIFAGEEMEVRYLKLLQQHGAVYSREE